TTDIRDVLWAYIDRKKKLPATTLLRALGYSSDKEILDLFHLSEEVTINSKKAFEEVIGRVLATEIVLEEVQEVVDDETGEVKTAVSRKVLLDRDKVLEEDDYAAIKEAGYKKLLLVRHDEESAKSKKTGIKGLMDRTVLFQTLKKDPSWDEDSALAEVYRQIRTGEMPDKETARTVLERLFFSDKKYDLGEVGRYRLNKRLHVDIDLNILHLTKDDI
ncbi:hypothetical protein RZS08_24375, partial [Arthrospira platensis SPKY1]|nr:hypothetical protein [Arthrospira platensis SPKY1]